MMRKRPAWWALFSGGAALALLTLGWITGAWLALERREREASLFAEHQESLRLSLWRMDSWLGPELAREAERPFHDYLPFYEPERAYTQLLDAVDPGALCTPSPLLGAALRSPGCTSRSMPTAGSARPSCRRGKSSSSRSRAWRSPRNWSEAAACSPP
jgi:hypothetical protein